MAERLLLAEHAVHVDDLRRRFPNGDWIALGPGAQHRLDVSGIPYRIPEDFYPAEELASRARATLEKIRALCDRLDRKFGEEFRGPAGEEIAPFLSSIYPLAMLIGGVERRAFQLESLLKSHPGRTVSLHHTPVDLEGGLYKLTFSNRESIWGHIASLPGWPAAIDLIESVLPPEAPKSANWILEASESSIWLRSFLRALKEGRYSDLPKLLNPNGRPSLLVLGNMVEWEKMLHLSSQEGLRVFSATENALTEGPPSIRAMEGFNAFLENDQEVRLALRFGDVDYFPLLRGRLERIAAESPSDYERSLDRLRSLKERKGVKALLTSSAVSGRHHMILKAARTAGIPVLLWQHGFVGYDLRVNQLYEYADRMDSDVTLVYGDGVRRAYEGFAEDFPSRLVSVGSAMLDSIARSPETAVEPKKILYATTNYFLNHWYFGMGPGWSDNLFYRDQKRILEALELIHNEMGFEIVVKLHPSKEFLSPPWAVEVKEKPGWSLIKDESPFQDLMREANVVLLDCPSTTLLQSIAAGASVFALMKHWHYHPNILDLLKRRAPCFTTVEEMIENVRRFLTTKNYPGDREDLIFLRQFGIHDENSSAARRAAEVINQNVVGY